MPTLLTVLSGLLLITQAPPPPATPASPAQVMILGVTHFAGSGDFVLGAQRDILREEAQAQILSVTQALERFQPDRIVLE